MNFVSFAFLIFLPVVICLYWLLPHRFRKYWLLAASYFFYMYWNPVFIVLVLVSTALDYVCGLCMEKYRGNPGRKRLFLLLSICLNLGLLFTFKYLDFFNGIVNDLCVIASIPYRVPAMNLILPVGISFYTFQTMSYSIDVYRGRIPAEKDPVVFALYVTFFPQLVAGPIESAQNLLPQLKAEHKFNREDLAAGCRLLVSGFFRKVVIADFLARFVDRVYGMEGTVDGAAVAVATVLFGFQIYCDFSGYSEIAAGSARIMGIRLMRNFDRPYTAAGIRQFWRRWHISLSGWFTNYVYIPLGGNRMGLHRQNLGIMVVFFLSGLWHGARWTFVIWGLFHGILMITEHFVRRRMKNFKLPNWAGIGFTFCLVSFSWLFFRANSVEQLLSFLGVLASPWDLGAAAGALQMDLADAVLIIALLGSLPGLYKLSTVLDSGRKPAPIRDITWVYYLIVIIAAWMLRLEQNEINAFIYFQF